MVDEKWYANSSVSAAVGLVNATVLKDHEGFWRVMVADRSQ